MIRENLNPGVDIEGILPTLVDSRTIHAKEAIEILEENFGDRVFASRIRKTVRFAEAPVKGMSVLKYEPDGVAAQSYRQLAQEVLTNGKRLKRASMREGPLAALFRKTDEESEESAAPPDPQPSERSRDSDAPHPALKASAETRERACGQRRAGSQPARAPAPRVLLGDPRERDGPAPRGPGDGRVRPRAPGRCAASLGAGPAGTVDQPVIRVVGVGGAGVNAVNRMVEAEVEGVEFLAVNTDLQSLQQSTADVTLHIGAELTRGLGSGSDANVGRQAAMEDYDRVKALLKGSDMIFITAGAGGGTGTGAAPIVARISRGSRGAHRRDRDQAVRLRGLAPLRAGRARACARSPQEVDTLIVVPNNRLLAVLDKQTAMVEAFRVADDVLRQGVQGISDLVTLPGLINLDFADVRTIMSDAGNALLGIGMGVGENRATEAAMQAVSSPLLETSMDGAQVDPAVDHRWQQPVAVGGQRGRQVRLARPPTPTRTSSSARWSMRSSTTRCG